LKLWALLLLCWVGHGATSFLYWIEPCATAAPSGCRGGDPELAQWAIEAWQAASSGGLTASRTSEIEKAQIRVHWASGAGGMYGETRPILVGGLRGAEVYVLPPRNSGEIETLLRDAVVYLTCLHETGHALGLEHTSNFADIMYNFQYGGDIEEYFGRYRRQLSSRADIAKHSGMSAQDRKRLLQIYGSN
jgi:hypothetical protein